MIRKPAVANQFYPGKRQILERTVESFVDNDAIVEDCLSMIAPHAGYIYSGKVAGSIYSSVNICDNIILIGPNHTGLGEPAAIMTSGSWEIPTGNVAINEELSNILIEETSLLTDDATAHIQEHSLEVQLPFIHHFNPEANIVPMTIMHLSFEDCVELGLAIAMGIKKYNEDTLIVVSSDMNHYESEETTKIKDKNAIDRILALDPKGLLDITEIEDISMCGVIPAVIALVAANELGATEARLVDHATSGDTSGDYTQVVGYAGILIN